jgi:DNA-binding CsgD family transcriptional regulator
MSDLHPQQTLVLVDLAERAGVEPAILLEGLGFDRLSLSRGRRVRWDDYVEVVSRMERHLGRDRMIELAYRTHEVVPDMGAVAALLVEPESIYRLLARLAPITMSPMAMRVRRMSEPRCIRFDMELRPGYADAPLVFEVATLAFSTTTVHLGLPPARILEHDWGPRHSRMLLELPRSRTIVERARRGEGLALREDWARAREFLRDVVANRGGSTRERARDAVVAEIAHDLASEHDLHRLCDALADRLMDRLALEGVRIGVGSAHRPMRERGSCEGFRIRRVLRFGGADVGVLEAFVAPEHVSRTGMALDAILPWTSTAVGMALDRHAAERARRAEQRDATAADALDAATHALTDAAVFELEPDGAITAHTASARAQLAADEAGTRSRLARAAARERVGLSVVRVDDGGTRLLLVDAPARALDAFARAIDANPRQRVLLEHLVAGRSNKEIAHQLGCAEVTIETQLTALYQRAGVRSRYELLLAALRGL